MPKIETRPLKKRHLGWMSECRKKNVIVAAAFLAMTHCKPPAGAVAPVFDLSRVIAESSFNIGTLESSQTLDCDFLRFFSFSTTALGDIEAVIDWNRDSNRLDAVIYRGQCNCRLSQRNACEDVVASSIGEPPAKPTFARSSNRTTQNPKPSSPCGIHCRRSLFLGHCG